MRPTPPNHARSRRAAATALAALAAALCLVAIAPAASASPRQISIVQDDATFVNGSGRDPDAAMAEAKALGADVIRIFVSWYLVSPRSDAREMPAGFDPSDPDSPGYDWRVYDQFVERARRHDMPVMLTLSPAIPFWASEQPRRCPHRIGGYGNLAMSCMWKPRVDLFGQFAEAVAKRYGGGPDAGPYGGQVTLWGMWNEPNLEHYLHPQLRERRFGTVDLAAARYRELWLAGWRAVARHDPRNRGRVLFGDTAAISSPMDTLYAALCLDPEGRPFRNRRLRRAHGCAGRVRRLPIGGLALHPYNNFAVGSVWTRSHTRDSLPLPYLTRAHTLLARAQRYRRIPRGRGIYLTEFGFQTSPPDPRGEALGLRRQAAAINEADRLFWADRRIRAVAQYELYDVESPADFNTGLRRHDGRAKPALAAYRMPLVVSRLRRGRGVEVWGQVRPAQGRVRTRVRLVRGGRLGRTVRRPRTNPAGYYRFVLRGARAERLRLRADWEAPDGETLRSRVARAGRPIAYLE